MKNVFLIILILGIALLYGCSSQIENIEKEDTIKEKDESFSNWKDIELKDIRTGKEFKISDFKGKPILLESFAVWCPTCKRQQDEIKKVHQKLGSSVISISLDTDPNEDENKVKEHIEKNNYDWYYAISPVELTQSLIEEFGVGVVSAPSVPIILINKDQSATLLKRGIKSSEDLELELK
jgi:thiol-disulfide isomerase/thioredoxin